MLAHTLVKQALVEENMLQLNPGIVQERFPAEQHSYLNFMVLHILGRSRHGHSFTEATVSLRFTDIVVHSFCFLDAACRSCSGDHDPKRYHFAIIMLFEAP